MVRIAPSFLPQPFSPFVQPGQSAPAGAPQGLGDIFGGGAAGADLSGFLAQAGQGAMMLNPALMLLGMPNLGTGRDLGVLGADPLQGMDAAQLTKAIQDMFAELNAQGVPLEARPGSKLAEAMANGDFSGIPPQELMALLVALALYGNNRNQPGNAAQGANNPIAPRGSWNPATGGNNFGGGTAHTGANANAPAATGPAPTGAAPTTSGPLASRIGDSAEATANQMGSTGWCYRGVKNALAQQGVNVTGGSAYMAADQLAAMPDKFQEVQVSPNELRNLPRGAVVVWGKTGSSPHGHISVALGDGREASDHIQSQITSLRGATNYRVFIPRG